MPTISVREAKSEYDVIIVGSGAGGGQMAYSLTPAGLKWVEEESHRWFEKDFAELTTEQQRALCDEMCKQDHTDGELRRAAAFFRSFTSLSMGAYYIHPKVGKPSVTPAMFLLLHSLDLPKKF